MASIGRPKNPDIQKRNAEILRLYRYGADSGMLARKFKCGQANVSRIISESGFTRHDGGKVVMAAILREAEEEHKFYRKRGVAPCEFGSLCKAKLAYKRFYEQRRQAKVRGVPFLMTFAEWWGVWKSSGRWEERGRARAHKYVMARYADRGPYAVGNVRVITHSENIVESWKTSPNRFDHRKRLLVN